MVNRRLKTLIPFALVAALLVLAACTRSASTPPPSPGAEGAPTEDLSPQQATMEAVRSALLTQTAQASGGAQPTATQPAPAETEEAAPPAATETPAPPPSPTPGVPESYTLQEGEHPYCIARRFNVNPDELLSLNGLSRTSVVFPGTTLRIPQTGNPFPGERALLAHPTTYTVVAGDTIYSVACKFGDVDPLAIAQANGLTEPYTLTPGTTIQIP